MSYAAAGVGHVYRDYYSRGDIEPRACHPRDLMAHIRDEADYRGTIPDLTAETMEQACCTYFLELPSAGVRPPSGTAHDRSQ